MGPYGDLMWDLMETLCGTLWRPYVGQKLTFMREHDNRHDKFAVAGKIMLKGKIGLIIVGHIPRELSRYTWYFC